MKAFGIVAALATAVQAVALIVLHLRGDRFAAASITCT